MHGQKEPTYRVVWMSTKTGQQGHGEFLDLKTAEDWVNDMNSKYPEIRHWVEPVADLTEETRGGV